MIDLMQRGVEVFPSCLCQTLARSKTAQAFVLSRFTPALTRVATRRIELLETINLYNRERVGQVVTKCDHKHCGHGVRLFNDIETLYSMTGLDDKSYPLVVQPRLKNFIDIRVIAIGDYIEAYTRENPYNFRSNMAMGGNSRPYAPTADQVEFCRRVMERGRFPYAHIDLMIFENGDVFLSEIALNGGMKGSKIDRKTLDDKKRRRLETLAADCVKNQTNRK
jgi:ribosomal protein S6--L-glutamate ligase